MTEMARRTGWSQTKRSLAATSSRMRVAGFSLRVTLNERRTSSSAAAETRNESASIRITDSTDTTVSMAPPMRGR